MIFKIIIGYQNIIQYLFSVIKNTSLMFLIPLIFVLLFLTKYFNNAFENGRLRREYTILEKKESLAEIIIKKLNFDLRIDKGKKNNTYKSIIKKTINYIANQISVFNEYSINENRKIFLYIILIILLMITTFLLTFKPDQLWYVTLFSLVIILTSVMFILALAVSFTKFSMINKLPDTFKLLNSRFISKGSMLKAIDTSIEDFPKPVKREMKKISSVLDENDLEKTEDTFENIEKTYNNEYMTILLLLIKQAHFKGSGEMIKEQFEEVVEDMLDEIENKKDLSSVSKLYMLVTVIFIPIMMIVIEKFSIAGIGDSAIDFYASPVGLGIKILVYISVVIYMGTLLYLEKSV